MGKRLKKINEIGWKE